MSVVTSAPRPPGRIQKFVDRQRLHATLIYVPSPAVIPGDYDGFGGQIDALGDCRGCYETK